MKIDALHLTAFGPFTDTSLDFTGADPGFHLVYGPNEAGKSSALRALRALLYGIDERTPDSFIHPYSRLRVGGRLAAEDGRRLEIVRRKGRTNTLRAADDHTVVDESVLAGFLNRVDAGLFSKMFGISHDDLVAGGKEIVSGGGDLGKLVFSAGSGIVRLKEIRDALRQEADSLFKPSGKVPAINAALLSLKENEKQLRENTLAGDHWTRLDKELKEASEKRQAAETQLEEKQKARLKLARIKQALPLIARRRELTDRLKSYEDAPLLADDFPETRRDLAARLDMAEQEAERAGKAAKAIQEEMSGLSPADALLENAGLIEEFHRQLGGQHKAAADRVGLETRRAALLGECRQILRGLSDELSLEDAERLRIKKDRAAAIRRLSSEYEQISARIENARDLLPGLEDEITGLEKRKKAMEEPAQPKAMEELRAALSEASEYASLGKQNLQDAESLESGESVLAGRAVRLGLSAMSAAELEKLPVPETETIQTFEDSLDRASSRIQEAEKELEKSEQQIREAETSIKARQMAHEVPSEEDLKEARAARDLRWQLIRKKLEGRPPDKDEAAFSVSGYRSGQTLEQAFEHHLRTADELSDRLRREADRVAEHARLTADLQAAADRKGELENLLKQAQKNKEKILSSWAGLWYQAGIEPGTPREMERWKRDLEALKEDLRQFEAGRRKVLDLNKQICSCRNTLAEALENLGHEPGNDNLNRLVLRAGEIIEREKSLAAEYEKIDSELASRRKELSAAKNRLEAGENALQRWRAQWQKAVFPLGLSADAGPEEADAVMEEIRSLFEKLKEAETLYKRIQGIDRDARSFEQGVLHLAEAVAPDLGGKQAEDIALKLHSRLTGSRDAKTRYESLEKQLAAERQNLEKARKTAAEIKSRLDRMCAEAGCSNYGELAGAEQRSRQRRNLEQEIKRLEERILELSAGATVDEFADEAAAVDPDTIDPQIRRYDEEIAALSEQKDFLGETIGSLRNEISKMDGSARAAELAQQRQQILGRLDPEVRRFARVKTAARILDTAIERFREKNQGPVLRRASELFSQITCGSFMGARAEFDDAGDPVITGVRGSNGEPVLVSGMSDGTADQLYLALRLAGLEMTIEKTSPMPFIVDDILIKFDNDRAAAALKILSQLSEQTQVIFFTHHYHLVELAGHSLAGGSVVYHKL